jgi:hypothetical protein
MNPRITVASLGFALLLAPAACTQPEAPAPGAKAPAAAKEPAAKPAKPAAAAGKEVDLAPLPLKLTLPAGEAGMTMDKTMPGGKKSVGVSYDAIFGGLNVSEPTEKSFDEVKKAAKANGIFPFKRWVQESPTSAVEEFTNEGKTAYIAWSWKDVGGKPYLCQSAGLSGLKTPEDAVKALKACDTLAAK